MKPNGLMAPLDHTMKPPEDLIHERDAMMALEAATKSEGTKLSENLYGIDWVFSRNDVPLFLGEYKWRNTRYKTLIISVGKILKGETLASAMNIPFFLFVEWPGDGIFYCQGDLVSRSKIVMAGNGRGQTGDKEPCYDTSTKLFKKLV